MPKVSVIIPTYNRARLVCEAVESVLNQTYQDLEIIVVDDGSTDNTEEFLQPFKEKIRYVYQPNKGLSCARNKGISIAKGEYITLLDSDDLWLPDKLKRQLSLFNKQPQVGLVYSDSYIVDLDDNILGRSFEENKPYRGKVLPQLFMNNFIPCLTVVIRRSILDKVGLFDPACSIAADYDLSLRITERYEVDFVRVPLAKYRVHGSRMSKDRESACKEEIAIVENCFQRHPELRDILKSKIKRRKAELYYNLGHSYFLNGEHRKARKELVRSMKASLYSPKQFMLYFFGFCVQNPLFNLLIRKGWHKRTIIMKR